MSRRVYTRLSALTEKNIDVLEEISKWDELIPSIQNFKEWTKERCRDAQNSYRDGQLDPIVDIFVAAFANSNKAIKDGYDSQIKQYDHQLNGYTKETAYGTRRFFGADEIRQMFERATPELLRKIAGVIAEHGCKDVKECLQKSPWYREFELEREAERKLKRDRQCYNFTKAIKMPSSVTITSRFCIITYNYYDFGAIINKMYSCEALDGKHSSSKQKRIIDRIVQIFKQLDVLEKALGE